MDFESNVNSQMGTMYLFCNRMVLCICVLHLFLTDSVVHCHGEDGCSVDLSPHIQA